MVCPCLAPFVVHTWRDRAHAIYDKCSQMVSPYAWIFGQFCVWFFFSAVFYSTLSGNFYTGCSIPFNLFSQLVLSIQKCLLACGQWRIKKNHIGIIIHIDARMAYTNDLSLIACKYSSFAFGFIGFSSLIETIRIFMPRMKWNKIRKIERVVGRPCCEQRKLPVLRRALCRRWNLSKIWLWVVYG